MATAVVLVVGFFLLSAFTGIYTDKLWFDAVGYSSVFSRLVWTKVLLFVVFGLIMGLVIAVNMYLAYRFRPVFRPASLEQASLDRYRQVLEPSRLWVLLGVSGLFALFSGGSAVGQWRTFMLWAHRQSFGSTDPYFHKDLGFYFFTLPWLHYIVNFAMVALAFALVISVVVQYLFGGIRLQSQGERVTGAAHVQLSLLLGLFLVVKAADYWLGRFDVLTTQGNRFTGMNYTSDHAVVPSKNILIFIALICALLLFANVVRRSWILPSVGIGLLVLSAILLGAVWPGIVWQFQVRPSEPDKEAPYLTQNIQATRAAYDVSDVNETQYDANVSVTPTQLKADAESLPGIRLLDPQRVSDTFEQLQQVRGYYSVAPVLDVDRYPINGHQRDLVLAVRELDLNGLKPEQRNWANDHTVYTHGYGVIAAYGNQRNAQDQVQLNNGEPFFAEKDLPPTGELTALNGGSYEGRVYYGEKSPDYSIVGHAPGAPDVELNLPEEGTSAGGYTMYGGPGVPVGSLFHKVLYMVKFGEPNFLLSSRVNPESKVLYDRSPRDRIETVAPWLTVDGDPYPAVVDGHITWVVDCYTTSSAYPNSELRSLQQMTSDSLTPQTNYLTLPSDQINYMRNSVKATVDAYTGKVTLYQWQSDPLLTAWSAAFPGVVQPKADIPPDLLAHMRYPEDQFKVQRDILAQYHVLDPYQFYGGTDRWTVPQDPSDPSHTTAQPPYRLSIQMPGTDGTPAFSLTSVYVPANRSNLAAFIAVNGEANSPDYGHIRILRLPDNTQVQGPSQIANTFAADDRIQSVLLPIKNNSQIIYGNLLTLPVGGGLLYVQPVYALQQSGEGSYPVLRFVLTSFGKEAGFGSTLTEALDDVLNVSAGTVAGATGDTGSGTGTGSGSGSGSGTGGSTGPQTPGGSDALALLQQADDKFAEAQTALKSGDLQAYANAMTAAQSLVNQAISLLQAQSGGTTG